jgi:putative oxidoreductase
MNLCIEWHMVYYFPVQIVYHIVRLLLAPAVLFVAASQLGYVPPPDPAVFTTDAWKFLQSLRSVEYIFPLTGVLCGLCGVAFLLNRYIALASIVLLPIALNIALFHGYLEPSPFSPNAIPAYVLLAANVFLLFASRERWSSVLMQ